MVEAVWYHQPWVEGKCRYDECLQKWLELAEVEQMMCEDDCTLWWQGRGPACDYRLDCRAWAPGPLVRWPPLEKVEWSNSTSLQSPGQPLWWRHVLLMLRLFPTIGPIKGWGDDGHLNPGVVALQGGVGHLMPEANSPKFQTSPAWRLP